MGNHDQVRVDRAAYQTHADDTHANLGDFRTAGDTADRQQAHLQNMTESGVGSDEYGSIRSSARHAVEELHSNSMKLTSRTSENADEFIGNVRSAASKNLRGV